jgi:chromosomal replication initiation ATPase DnaA
MPIPVSLLAERAAILFDTTAKDILGRAKFTHIMRARHAVAYAAVASGRGLCEAGRHLGGRDHTTIDNSRMRVAEFVKRDPEYRANVEALVAYALDWAERHRQELVPPKAVRAIKDQGREEQRMSA